MNRPLRALIVTLLALAVTLPASAQTPAKLRVATVPIENGAQVFYAKELGFFAKAGLDVEIQTIGSGSAVTAAVASSAVDIGFASLVPLAIAHTKGVPFVIIAAGAVWQQNAKNNALFVGATSSIRTGKDLNGKTLATAGLGTLTEFAPRAWIEQHGGDPSTVKFVEVPYSEMPAAIVAGRIDAALVNEPYLGLTKSLRAIGWPYDAVGSEFLIGGWFTSAAWSKDHADLAARFAQAMREAAQWANDPRNLAKANEILVRSTKLDPALAATMIHVRFADRLTPALVQPQIDVSAKYAGFATFPAREIMAAP